MVRIAPSPPRSPAALAKEIHALHIPTVITQYIYVIFLAFCFLLSMGNRPAGTTRGYAPVSYTHL